MIRLTLEECTKIGRVIKLDVNGSLYPCLNQAEIHWAKKQVEGAREQGFPETEIVYLD